MVSFRTTIQNHSIEMPSTHEIPDGTEVMVQIIPVHHVFASQDSDWDDTPEEIADWLNWLDSLESLSFSEEERIALTEDRQARKQWEQERFSDHVDRLAGEWK